MKCIAEYIILQPNEDPISPDLRTIVFQQRDHNQKIFKRPQTRAQNRNIYDMAR